MASEISLKDQYLWVSNRRLSSLIAFGLQVGGESARSDAERGWVEKLRQFDEGAFPGISFDLDERFPDVEEKQFWARVYGDVARRIFLRQLGDHDATFWQSSAIGDAYVIGRMLTAAVLEVEGPGSWHPDMEDAREAGAYHGGRTNLRL